MLTGRIEETADEGQPFWVVGTILAPSNRDPNISPQTV